MVLKVGYVASHGYNLLFPVDLNAVPEQFLGSSDISGPSTLSALPGHQQRQLVQAARTTVSPTTTRCRPTVSQRLSHGLEFNANYVWSHMLDTSIDSSGWGSSSGSDYLPEVLQCGGQLWSIELRCSQCLQDSGALRPAVRQGQSIPEQQCVPGRGNWRMAGCANDRLDLRQSVHTVTMSRTTPSDQTGNGQQFPNQVGDPNPLHRTINSGINPAAFAQPAAAHLRQHATE